jgi:hypothetical protein
MATNEDDDLVRLQMDETEIAEARMAIDIISSPDYYRIFLLFGLGLSLLLLIGMFGPHAVVTHAGLPYRLSPESRSAVVSIPFFLDHLSSLNRFLRVSFTFFKETNYQPIQADLQYRYDFQFHGPNNDEQVIKSEFVQKVHLIVPGNQRMSPRLVAFSDVVIDYTSFNFTLELLEIPAGFGAVRITANYGDVSHTYLQAFLRLGYAVVACCFAAWWLRATWNQHWFFEQRLTFPLLILSIFGSNPLFILNAIAPSQSYIVFDTIARNCFDAYFRFFILALFSSLRFKNRETDGWFYGPKIAIVLALFLSSVVHGIYDDVTLFGLPTVSKDNVEVNLRGTQLVLYIIYLAWAGGSIMRSYCGVDVTERFRFNAYFGAGGSALASTAVVHLLFAHVQALRQTSLHFVIGFAVENGFVLLMTYLHRPFAQQTATAIEDQRRQDGDFFTNNDEKEVVEP